MSCFVELYEIKISWFLLQSQRQQVFLSGPAAAGVSKWKGGDQSWETLCVQNEREVWDFWWGVRQRKVWTPA